jgi:dihydrodipicolinate synthase/N-acetylneuraminate lyase
MLLSGIFPPITTPFYPDGKLYFKKLESNVEHYSRTPAVGLVALGSTGEAILLSDQERREVLKTVREAVAPHKVLIAGTGVESAIETSRLTEYAAELGYDVAMVRTPHYFKKQMQPANVLAFYRTVADRSPIPVILYNVPGCTGYNLPVDMVRALSEHPNIIGIKDSSGDVEKVGLMVDCTRHIKRTSTVTVSFEAVTPRMLHAATNNGSDRQLISIGALAESSNSMGTGKVGEVRSSGQAPGQAAPGLKTRQKEVGFQVLVGAAHQLLSSLKAGATGAILGMANFAPTACYEIYAAWKEGDSELAALKQARIIAASNRIVGDFGVAGTKYAMDLNGYYGGSVRLPLLPLTSDLKAEVERLTGDIRN